MQLQDMVSRVRKTIGEVEPSGYGTQGNGDGSWDNSQIIGYINEALGLMAHYWKKEKMGSIAVTTNGQTDFSLPLDALEDGIRTVSYVTAGSSYPIRYASLDQYNSYLTNAIPYGNVGRVLDYLYTVFAGTIKIWPGAASTSDTLQPFYYRVPATLVNAADVPEIPSRFHIGLVYYAISECHNAVEEVNLESDAAAKWKGVLSQFRNEMSRNQRDRGVTVRGRR